MLRRSKRMGEKGGEKREGMNDEKLCRPTRLVRSPGYETARRMDGQTNEKNEWPFLLQRRRARRSVITSFSLSFSRPCSPCLRREERRYADERKNNSLPPSLSPLYPWSTIKTLSRAYSQGREELLSLVVVNRLIDSLARQFRRNDETKGFERIAHIPFLTLDIGASR